MKKQGFLILILFLSIFLRIFLLDLESLWLDEGTSVKFARLSIGEMIKSTDHPPLYYLILHIWIKIFGDSEFSVRFPSVIFGILVVLAVYKFCLEFWSREVALISSLITGISTFQVFYSQEARMYSLLCLLSVLSFFYFVKALKNPRLRFYVAYSVVNILLLYTHHYSFFILFSQFIYVALLERKELIKVIFAFFIVFLFYIPRLSVVLRQTDTLISGEFWLPRPGLMDILKTFAQFAGASYPMPRDESGNIMLSKFVMEYSSSGVLLLIMLTLAFFAIFRFKKFSNEQRKIYVVLLLWFLLPIFVPYVLSQFLTPFYFTRYVIASSVAFYVIISIGLENFEGRFKVYLLSAIVFLSVINLAWYYAKTNKEQWREAVRFVEDRADSRDLIVASKYVFYYYSKRKDINKFNVPDLEGSEGAKVLNQFIPMFSKYDAIWFVSSHSSKVEKLLIKFLLDSMSLRLKKNFLGIEVFVFEKKGLRGG